MCKPALLLIALTTLCFSSCHFGHSAEEIMNKYKDVERDLEFTFVAPTPGGSTRVTMVDNGLGGVATRWEDIDAIALFDFGLVFVEPTTAISLGYDKDEDDIHGVDFASFKGQAKAKMGENVFDGKDFALMYPYGKFGNCPATSSTVELDFVGQDGSLDLLRKEFLYAWGMAFGKCEDAVVTLYENQAGCSSDQEWHAHESGSEEIILDNKMAIVRFSMIGGDVSFEGDTTWKCLTEFLADKGLLIDKVIISGDSLSIPFSKATVNLHDGKVTPSPTASRSLTVTKNPSYPFVEIPKEEATPESYAPNAKKVAWGTSFYLSIPCTMQGVLPFTPILTIHTIDARSGKAGTTYYGSLSHKVLKEGDYYMTAPIKVVDSKVKLQESAQIYLYYHSSFVFDIDAIY